MASKYHRFLGLPRSLLRFGLHWNHVLKFLYFKLLCIYINDVKLLARQFITYDPMRDWISNVSDPAQGGRNFFYFIYFSSWALRVKKKKVWNPWMGNIKHNTERHITKKINFEFNNYIFILLLKVCNVLNGVFNGSKNEKKNYRHYRLKCSAVRLTCQNYSFGPHTVSVFWQPWRSCDVPYGPTIAILSKTIVVHTHIHIFMFLTSEFKFKDQDI
jgi:hypothetical protein